LPGAASWVTLAPLMNRIDGSTECSSARAASSSRNPLVAPAGRAEQSPVRRASDPAQRRARSDAPDGFGSLRQPRPAPATRFSLAFFEGEVWGENSPRRNLAPCAHELQRRRRLLPRLLWRRGMGRGGSQSPSDRQVHGEEVPRLKSIGRFMESLPVLLSSHRAHEPGRKTPHPNPLPARSSRGEGDGAEAAKRWFMERRRPVSHRSGGLRRGARPPSGLAAG